MGSERGGTAPSIFNQLTRAIHDRMPALLDEADFEAWLGGTGGIELLRSAAEDHLRMAGVEARQQDQW